MLHDENEHLMEDDQQNSFLYWGPPISQEWKSLNIDQKTMGISNVPCKPSGIAIILKEPGKAKDDDVTKMFPKKGGIGKAGYKAPYDSLNVAYNHEWWTCLGDEKKKSTHRENCCEGNQIRSYKGRCTRYRNYFRKLCSLVLSTIDASSDDSAFLANIYLANICYPSEPGTVGFTNASSFYRNMDETEKVARFLSLIDWMKNNSVEKYEANIGEELKYVFVQKDLYELLLKHFNIRESASYPYISYSDGDQYAFYFERLGIWIISTYHPLARRKLSLETSEQNIKNTKSKN